MRENRRRPFGLLSTELLPKRYRAGLTNVPPSGLESWPVFTYTLKALAETKGFLAALNTLRYPKQTFQPPVNGLAKALLSAPVELVSFPVAVLREL